MCDEFAMLIATFIVFYRLLTFSQTRFSPGILLGGLCTLMGIVIVAQKMTGESTVQQIVFTVMVYWLWHTCFTLIGKLESENGLKKKMRWMAISGIGKPLLKFHSQALLILICKAFFVTGHLCWLTDFYACDSLRHWRKTIGMPYASLLELHG